jgi:hypothetical protein
MPDREVVVSTKQTPVNWDGNIEELQGILHLTYP